MLATAALILPFTGMITAKEPAPAPRQEASSVETKIEGLVINADKKPIADTRIGILGYVGDKANALKPIYLRTDEEGRFRANVPSKRFRMGVGSPSEEYDDAGRIGVRDGRAFSGWSNVEDRSSDGVVRPVVTLGKRSRGDGESPRRHGGGGEARVGRAPSGA